MGDNFDSITLLDFIYAYTSFNYIRNYIGMNVVRAGSFNSCNSMVDKLSKHEDWALYDENLRYQKNGNGLSSLKPCLPDDGCAFAVYRICAENVGNTGAGIITEANIILLFKGKNASGMKKVKFNGNLNAALSQLSPNKGTLEVLTKGNNLTTANIIDRWQPGSGSKVIED